MENSVPTASSPRSPEIGVAVFVLDGGKVLFGRRLSSLGHKTFCVPGGHLEFGESFEECAAREVKEETGMEIDKIEYLTAENHVLVEEIKPAHVVCIFMRAVLAYPNQLPQNLEPDKCEGWGWYHWNDLPKPLMLPLETIVRSGFTPFDNNF